MEFYELYNNLKSEFENTSNFSCLNGNNESFKWPASSGVYVVWKTTNKNDKQLIYIGMTGKFIKKSDGSITFKNKSFDSRKNRYTPYRFCESKKDHNKRYHFKYEPKESNTNKQAKIKYSEDAYKFSIPYTEIEIHCFHINSEHPEYTPVLLESLLLTKYLKTYGRLPPANKSL